jgi:hypothetical protein
MALDRSRRRPPTASHVTLTDRLVAAFLAPLAFNIFLLICACVVLRRASPWHLGPWPWDGPTAAWALVLLPALAGFVGGTDGLVALAGHAFLTHAEPEQRWWATLLIWAVIAGSACVVASR